MTKKKFWCNMKKDKMKKNMNCGCGGGIYFLGFIGAAVYYIQQSTTFWQGVFGVLKALIWPAFLIYELLG